MKILISGALGHMGRAVAAQASADGIEIVAGVDALQGDCSFPCHTGFDALPDCSGAVIVDFSRPEALTSLLAYAVKNHLPVVLATTGYTPEQEQEVDQAARQIPVFRSANMSVGVALLRHLCQEAAKVLGETFDVEIVEAHHNRKVDAPSGTALMLADAAASARSQPSEYIYDRHSVRQPRGCDEIGISSVRGGTIVGEHEVIFAGRDEVIELRHSAQSREIFASGALRAARFLAAPGQRPGLYSMSDLVASVAE